MNYNRRISNSFYKRLTHSLNSNSKNRMIVTKVQLRLSWLFWPGGPGWPWPGRPVGRPAYGSRPDSYIALFAVVVMMLAIVFVTGRSDGSAGWACCCPAAAAALIATVAACLHCKSAWTLLLCLVYFMAARLVSPCLGDSYQRCMMCLMCCVYDDVYDDVV